MSRQSWEFLFQAFSASFACRLVQRRVSSALFDHEWSFFLFEIFSTFDIGVFFLQCTQLRRVSWLLTQRRLSQPIRCLKKSRWSTNEWRYVTVESRAQHLVSLCFTADCQLTFAAQHRSCVNLRKLNTPVEIQFSTCWLMTLTLQDVNLSEKVDVIVSEWMVRPRLAPEQLEPLDQNANLFKWQENGVLLKKAVVILFKFSAIQNMIRWICSNSIHQGHCLLFENMLPSVLFARDHWLKKVKILCFRQKRSFIEDERSF